MTDVEQIGIQDAEIGQLRTFAEQHLGLEFKPSTNRTTMIAKIRQTGYDKEEIPKLVDDEAGQRIDTAPAQTAAIPGKPHFQEHRGKMREYRRIMIPQSLEDGGEVPAFVAVNGVGMFIERGVESLVPIEYVESLMNAVQLIYPPFILKEGEEPPPPKKVLAYPFQALSH